MNDCKEIVEFYLRCLHKDDKSHWIGHLYTIFQLGVCNGYTQEDHDFVLRKLIEDSEGCDVKELKILELCFAYKIKKKNGSIVNVPIIKSDVMLDFAHFNEDELPSIDDPMLVELYDGWSPDEELADLFNAKISKDNFITMDISDIPKKRRLEIDNILRESEKNIKPHNDNYMTLEEFSENIKKMFVEPIK